MKYDVAVIGGGASGLACAVRLLRKSRKIKLALIDANERLGKKLASTGNGQGNVTNLNMSPDKYFSSNINTVKDIALSSNGIAPEKELFHCILQSDEKGRVYPSGRQASALVDSLLSEIGGGNVDVFKGVKVTEIETGFKITLSDGQKIFSDYVVVATGGKAQKQFKTDGSSYGLVKKFGHETTPLFPSLVQLKTDTQYTKSLKGIRINCIVTALCKNQEIATVAGDVILPITVYPVMRYFPFRLTLRTSRTLCCRYVCLMKQMKILLRISEIKRTSISEVRTFKRHSSQSDRKSSNKPLSKR